MLSITGQWPLNVLTVNSLNFWTTENFAVIYLKFKQNGKTLIFRLKDANGIANSEDPDQTAPLVFRMRL